ncbi:hypothetical protein [Actinomadura violacea]|uniref:Minor tail protein n=1 Tax=Actinomadura violacea TaxID=2819934 RepID=A0ABS3RW44_9ACTN|nr:hypothetical protein [Actinomadura violacea]MBO2460977.1 hypothetical protein [Actinomadura violacea]
MPTQAPPQQAQAAAPVAPPPFRRGVYEVEGTDYDQTKTMATGTVQFPTYTPRVNDWLTGIWFLIECTTASNAATVAFKADAPFSAIDHVTFYDTGNQPVFGPITGYDWLTIMKFGGYFLVGDPRSDISYSATAGSGSTGGSFSMVMYLPLEFVKRDSLGAVENKSTATSYTVEIVLAKSTDVYSTAPTTLGNVRIRTTLDGYTSPQPADPRSGVAHADSPPVPGTFQYWRSENVQLTAGSMSNVQRNGLGFPIRNILYKLVDSTGSRSQGDADWPDPVTVNFGRITLFQRQTKLWLSRMGKNYGLTSTSTDVSLGRENGVYPVWFTDDFGFQPGAELRNGYLVTQVGNELQWQGTVGGSGTHTLYTLTNWIATPGNNYGALTGR